MARDISTEDERDNEVSARCVIIPLLVFALNFRFTEDFKI